MSTILRKLRYVTHIGLFMTLFFPRLVTFEGAQAAGIILPLVANEMAGVKAQVESNDAATTLAQLAVAMSPGTWAELQTIGLIQDLIQVGGYRSIFEYTDKGGWDPASKQLLFIGQGHNADLKFISYSDSTNTWREESGPSWWGGGIGHGYENNAIDTVHRLFFFHESYSLKIHRYDIANGLWRELPNLPSDTALAHGTALEYFPEMGGLVRVLGGSIHFYDEATGAWSLLGSGLSMGSYHNIALYNPVYQVVLFGGGNGSTELYQLDRNGNIQKFSPAPFPLAVASSVLSVDPVSGDYLAIGENNQYVSFDPSIGKWTERGSAVVGVSGTISSPIDSYGVTMFIHGNEGGYDGGKVYLYKHSPSDPPPIDNILRVGLGKPYAKPSDAAAAAKDGDVIEIDSGEYRGDVAIWRANNLTIRGVGGMAHLIADGKNAEGKAIWVIKGRNTTVENVEFSGATVPDQNGAGIRQEGDGLTVRHCYFHDNENGILGGGGPESEVIIESSEFARNGYGDGYSHNLYISNIRSFTLRYSYSHHAKIGHNVKTRARENHILYNRLMDEAYGTSSYVIDIPDGGTSYLIGNLIQQGPYTENSTIISFGAESLRNGSSDLFVINNTIVNDRGSGTFVRVASGATPAVLINNIFAGNGTVLSGPGTQSINLISYAPGFVDISNYDYRLTDVSAAIDAGSDPGSANGFNLLPLYQYVHKASAEERPTIGAIDIGAYEFGVAPTFVDVPFDHWAYNDIESLYRGGYIAGCGLNPLRYCPERILNRAEEAVYVVRGVHGAQFDPDDPEVEVFTDARYGEWFFDWTAQLYNDGYTSGCWDDPLQYCPLQENSVAEGCVFFLRMEKGPTHIPQDPVGVFTDVPVDAWYARWVEEAYSEGILLPCKTEPSLQACPLDPLDRATAAYMMARAKGLTSP